MFSPLDEEVVIEIKSLKKLRAKFDYLKDEKSLIKVHYFDPVTNILHKSLKQTKESHVLEMQLIKI
jgi:hypothetical protein